MGKHRGPEERTVPGSPPQVQRFPPIQQFGPESLCRPGIGAQCGRMVFDQDRGSAAPSVENAFEEEVCRRRLSPADSQIPGFQTAPTLDDLGHQGLLNPARPETEDLASLRVPLGKSRRLSPVPEVGPGVVESMVRDMALDDQRQEEHPQQAVWNRQAAADGRAAWALRSSRFAQNWK